MATKTFDTLSLDEQTELQVAAFSNQLPDKNVARNSDNWKRLRVTSGAVTDLHAHIDAAQRDALPDTAGEATIGRHGGIYHVERKGATPASGVNAGKIRGTNGSAWTTASALVHKSGLRFRTTTSGTLGVSGEALVGIIGIDVGPKTRLTAGEVLTWEVTPSGLENEVELVADLDQEGDDNEPIGEYRSRILNRIAQPAMGGNSNDWRTWILESSAAIKAGYIYPNRNGLGSVDLAALKGGSGAARLLDVAERAALLAYVNARRPVTAAARVLEVQTQALNVETTLVPESGVEFLQDWDDTAPPVVSTWTAGTRVLVFAAARPASMAAGHRLVVAGTTGLEMEIESLSGADAVVITDALGQSPAAAALVYSGGPLVTPARDAIVALFDSLGPRVGPFGYGDWEGQFRLSRFFEAVQTTVGVLDSTPITPLANVEPTAESYPTDTFVRLLIPGNVLVRYA
jgi:uncharacterized phage protein gp47/JayE